MDEYNILFKTKKFIGTQPVTFNEKSYDPNMKYFITEKLNGLRHLLCTINNKTFLVSSKMNIIPFYMKSTKMKGYVVVDGELYGDKFYAFDILYYNGTDLRDLSFSTRLDYLKKLGDFYKSSNFIVKKYYSPYLGTICKNFFNLKSKILIKLKKDILDGIIFTPDSNYQDKPLKWKLTSMLTIDFKIKIIDSKRMVLLTQDDKPFKFKSKSVIIENPGKFKDNTVLEFIYRKNSGKFIPLKERPDKLMSNHTRVIKDNLNTILSPPNMKKILCSK